MSEHIGYTEPFTREEWGAFLDLRDRGLGWRLMATGVSRQDVLTRTTTLSVWPAAPVVTRVRLVTRTPWALEPEHLPECNEHCGNGSHYLRGATP